MPPDLRVIAGIDHRVLAQPKLHFPVVGVRRKEVQVRLRSSGDNIRVAAAVPLGNAQNALPCAVLRDAEQELRAGQELGDALIRRTQAGDKQIPRRISKRCSDAVIEDFFRSHGAQVVRCAGDDFHRNQRRDRPRHVIAFANRVDERRQFQQFNGAIGDSVDGNFYIPCRFALIAPRNVVRCSANLPIRIILLGSLKKIRFRQHFRQRQGFGKRRQARAAHQEGKKTS